MSNCEDVSTSCNYVTLSQIICEEKIGFRRSIQQLLTMVHPLEWHPLFYNIARTPPSMRRPVSSHSKDTLSSDGSPQRRKPRPHSIAGRMPIMSNGKMPSYMASTSSFDSRISRDTQKKLTGKIQMLK